MTKNAIRRAQYQLLGKMISLSPEQIEQLTALNIQAWRDRTGNHQFEIRGRACKDPEISSRMFGPQTKTQQWERTSK